MKKIFLFLFSLSISVMVMAQSKIIAHQGYHATKNSVGNSLSSLKNAQDAGFFGTEFDVHETKDGVLIVGHGPEHGSYIIQETDFKTLRAHKLKNGETLPTFEECLIQGSKNVATKLIIEIKRHPSPDLETRIVKKILAEVKKHKMEEHVEYISFHQHVCNELIKYGPKGIQVAYLEGNLSPTYCKGLGYTGIDYQVNVMREHPEWIKEAQDLGMTVNVWEADDIESAKWCIEHGLDYITTDIPADVERLLKEKNK